MTGYKEAVQHRETTIWQEIADSAVSLESETIPSFCCGAVNLQETRSKQLLSSKNQFSLEFNNTNKSWECCNDLSDMWLGEHKGR